MECNKCNKRIIDNYTIVDNLYFHTNCFICSKCNCVIKNEYYEKNNKYYHQNCYNELLGVKCSVCNSYIESEYIINFWKDKSHTNHNGIKVIECRGCGEFIKANEIKLCDSCKTNVINDERLIYKLLGEILVEFSEIGILINKKNIKISIVPSNYFSKNKEQQGEAMTALTSFGMIKKYKHQIKVVENLTKLSFKGVLAHELLHTWLNEKEIEFYKYQIEGFCNLGSYLIYSNSNRKEAKLYINYLQNDISEIYGNGYRFMKSILDKVGWKELLNELQIMKNGKALEEKYKNLTKSLSVDDIFGDIEQRAFNTKINKPNIDDFNF